MNEPNEINESDEFRTGPNGNEPGWFNKKWSGLIWVDALSDGKRWHWEYFLTMNVMEFLNAIVYRMDRNLHEKEQNEAQNRMNVR